MSLNVNYNSLYQNGIDTSVLKDVSVEILKRAAQKSGNYNAASTQQVNSIGKTVELGVDLYKGNINTEMQRQIAMNNTLQFQLSQSTLNSINFLNSRAAISNIDGKFTPVVNEVTETQKSVETNSASHFVEISTSAAYKDKEGSNPFYNGELLAQNSDKKSKEDDSNIDALKSIFL